ncbi:putative nucleotidyltransferase substrate binding domain-containing protein [Rhodococcus sp. IEGM 1379]|uniref:putative nucleotidyltransferase substrate binding domain-containing protein n=1 Tax=Rhodococcus sp. IEGM 1379 TaxID=3047086 RepID=UPI0024B65E4D|nr:putative nucleotidyltransferase substrate binding domain-containing protein [Rhodococcus sp. IEGM 1379]MDI9915874.1 putative nucleotidyltransferase substrate binding domain-containing protein [Rhodococcus sp. IEGM 1379]
MNVVRDPSMRPVGELLRGPALTCTPQATAADAARAMTSASRRYVLVPLGDGRLGIFTDGDLRRRVVAAGLGTTTPIAEVMTTPVQTATADRLGADVLLDMLERGIRHLPILSERGDVLGVVEDADLFATATRSGFLLRGSISRAADADELVAATARIPELVVGLWRARIAALDVSAITSVIMDATVTRAAILLADSGSTWLSLGSIARREAMPSSDVDSALIWADGNPERQARELGYGNRVHALLERCGLPSDANGAIASSSRFARSESDWLRGLEGWLADPYADQGVVMVSLLADSRVAFGHNRLALSPAVFERLGPDSLRLLLKDAVEGKARMHSLRERLTRRANTVDIKAQGVMPIVNIARWAGLAAGCTDPSTAVRLRTAAGAGVLPDDDAAVLAESFDALAQIRLRHQCEQIDRGETPTDVTQLDSLTPLHRSLLASAVREIAGVQRKLAYAGPPA